MWKKIIGGNEKSNNVETYEVPVVVEICEKHNAEIREKLCAKVTEVMLILVILVM